MLTRQRSGKWNDQRESTRRVRKERNLTARGHQGKLTPCQEETPKTVIHNRHHYPRSLLHRISGASSAAASAKAITSHQPAWWLRLPNRLVSWVKYAADLASCIWKALGFVLRLIHTDYAKYYIAGHWKTGPKGLPAWGATPPTHTGETRGGLGPLPPPGSRRLWTSQNTSQIG